MQWDAKSLGSGRVKTQCVLRLEYHTKTSKFFPIVESAAGDAFRLVEGRIASL